MEEKKISPLKAIRLKCLECSNGSNHEVRLCPVEKCPLHIFRFGKNPNRAGVGGTGTFKAEQTHSASDPASNYIREG